MIAGLIGNEPLAERILETTSDAVRRFLNPGARLIPQRLRVYAVPVELPPRYRDRVRVSDAVLSSWRQNFGLDFTALAELSRRTPVSMQIKPSQLAEWPALSESCCVADFDLTRTSHPREPATAIIECFKAGTLEALAVWFAADLGSGHVLATDPAAMRPDNHWTHPVYVLATPVSVQVGDRIRLRIETRNSVQVSAERLQA